MKFEHPLLLLLLVFPLLLAAWEWKHKGHPLVLPFDHGEQRPGRRLRRLVLSANTLIPLMLATGILIISGPQRLAEPRRERAVTNIEFCMDVSGSMTSAFGDGNRADGALKAIVEFTSYRKGDAFGLTIFGTDVVHWVPITKDLSAIRLAAPFVRPEKMPSVMGGTRIGRALRAVGEVLRDRPEGDRMIVLISDGQSGDLGGGQAQAIGEDLRQDNITVNYIHVANGQPQNETYELVQLTGGEAYIAGDPNGLKEVFQKIDKMRPARLKPKAPEYADFFGPFALVGLGLLALHLISLFGLRFTPW